MSGGCCLDCKCPLWFSTVHNRTYSYLPRQRSSDAKYLTLCFNVLRTPAISSLWNVLMKQQGLSYGSSRKTASFEEVAGYPPTPVTISESIPVDFSNAWVRFLLFGIRRTSLHASCRPPSRYIPLQARCCQRQGMGYTQSRRI